MIRTIISLNENEKKWLDQMSQIKHVPMAQIIREAIQEYRQNHFNRSKTNFNSKRNLKLAQQLCDEFEQYPLTVADADMAAAFRKKYGWKLPDAFQAAIAKRHKLKLVTRNTKDFNPQKHSFVLIPYKI